MASRPVRTLRFSVVKERDKWLVRYKGVGGKSRQASKEEVQLALALRESKEDRDKLRIQKNKYEYTVEALRFAVDVMRHACHVSDSCHRLVHLARQAAKTMYKHKERPDYMLEACTELLEAIKDFDETTDLARDRLGVKQPAKKEL